MPGGHFLLRCWLFEIYMCQTNMYKMITLICLSSYHSGCQRIAIEADGKFISIFVPGYVSRNEHLISTFGTKNRHRSLVWWNQLPISVNTKIDTDADGTFISSPDSPIQSHWFCWRQHYSTRWISMKPMTKHSTAPSTSMNTLIFISIQFIPLHHSSALSYHLPLKSMLLLSSSLLK